MATIIEVKSDILDCIEHYVENLLIKIFFNTFNRLKI